MKQDVQYILTLSCMDVNGIVAAVSGFLTENKGFIIESAQFGDPFTKKFFMRTVFSIAPDGPNTKKLRDMFEKSVATPFNMEWTLRDTRKKMRLLVMVSKQGHCFNDILHRYFTGVLPVEIPAVVSNHPTLGEMATWHKIPFYHLPVTAETKPQQEEKIWELVEELDIDLVVLARYMQILSSDLSEKLSGRAINIHHSFLPSFKGAKPYHQAHDRGVKLIGATAHYVTSELDEGPIIEQEIARVDHTDTPEDLVSIGCDIESVVLARALKYHIEQRVLINGHKTVIFK